MKECGVKKRILRAISAGACVIALAGFAAAPGTAAGDTPDDQLVDVSKQVAGIEKKMNDLLAHGRWARSGELLASADCGYSEPSQVFASWTDMAMYTLAPQGDLSSTGGWTLDKESTVVTGGDPFSGAIHSLQLEKGAEAATPAMCVNLDNPTIRFFARDVGGNGKANLKLDVLYEDFDGHVKHLTIAKLHLGTDWQPSAIVPIYMNMLALASPDGLTAVAFKFKAEGLQKDETLSISSLYVDPFSSR
jgi:hypothetical protein